LVVLSLCVGLHWLADRPGTITIEWLGYIAETSMFRALIILAIVLTLAFAAWSLLRQAWRGPATVGRYLYRRRQKRGLDALTSGIIAVGAGDRALAVRYAAQARKALPHEPLTHLLSAQAAASPSRAGCARRPPRSAATVPPHGTSSKQCSPRPRPNNLVYVACSS